jgi:hypothetical protein
MLDYVEASFKPAEERAEALLHEACSYLHAVHGVDGVSTYEFFLDELPAGMHGQHRQAEEVVVSTKTPFPVLSAIHEIGHAIDAVFLNSVQGYGTPSDPYLYFGSNLAEQDPNSLLSDWLAAVQASNYWTNLQSALKESTITKGQAAEIQKLLKVRECWARSYEMFIAYRKSGTSLSKQMDNERKQSVTIGGTTVQNYWQGNDFDPIQVCIEEAFKKIGWLL